MNRVSRVSALCLAAAVFTMAMLTGCNGSKTGADDTARPHDTTSIADDDDPTPDKGGYPTDGKTEEWLKYVKDLDFNIDFAHIDSTAIIKYSCKEGDACFPGDIRFLVIPEKRVVNTKWENAMKIANKKGFVAAAYWNMDRADVKSLNLPSGENMYQWVGPVSESAVGIRLFNVDNNGMRISGRADGYRFCAEKNPHKKATVRKREVYVCPLGDSVTTSSAALSSAVTLFPEDLWISCAGGCCQSSLIQ